MATQELVDELQAEAEREVERLRSEGWTKADFADALKILLTEESCEQKGL